MEKNYDHTEIKKNKKKLGDVFETLVSFNLACHGGYHKPNKASFHVIQEPLFDFL